MGRLARIVLNEELAVGSGTFFASPIWVVGKLGHTEPGLRIPVPVDDGAVIDRPVVGRDVGGNGRDVDLLTIEVHDFAAVRGHFHPFLDRSLGEESPGRSRVCPGTVVLEATDPKFVSIAMVRITVSLSPISIVSGWVIYACN